MDKRVGRATTSREDATFVNKLVTRKLTAHNRGIIMGMSTKVVVEATRKTTVEMVAKIHKLLTTTSLFNSKRKDCVKSP